MFTKICLALLDGFEWSCIPSIPLWGQFFVWHGFYYEVACGSCKCMVPLLVILDNKQVFKFAKAKIVFVGHIAPHVSYVWFNLESD